MRYEGKGAFKVSLFNCDCQIERTHTLGLGRFVTLNIMFGPVPIPMPVVYNCVLCCRQLGVFGNCMARTRQNHNEKWLCYAKICHEGNFGCVIITNSEWRALICMAE